MTPFSYDLPYPSQREPVTAQRVVATSVPIAAVAGLEMLRRGGTHSLRKAEHPAVADSPR